MNACDDPINWSEHAPAQLFYAVRTMNPGWTEEQWRAEAERLMRGDMEEANAS